MQYLIVVIGLAAVTALLWKTFGPQRPAVRQVIAPDDDPDFLRGLNSQRPEPDER